MLDDAISALGFDRTVHVKLVRSWAHAEETGNYLAMNYFLGRHHSVVEASSDSTLQAAFAYYRAKADEALAYEREHGDGCLRKLDHPWWKSYLQAIATYDEWKRAGITGWTHGSPEERGLCNSVTTAAASSNSSR
jgi:hypothetical protein